MKKVFTSLLLVFLSMNLLSGQSKLGEVACVYITTPDLDSSMTVYEKLGFPRIASNSFPVPWAQVSDGSLLIMLRKDAAAFIGLTYYSASPEKKAEELEKAGIVFTQKPKEGDLLRRYYFKSPDEFTITITSNLGGFTQPNGVTLLGMKQEDFGSADKYPNKQCGVFGEFAHPVKDLAASLEFWKKLGFTVKYQEAMPYPHAIITDGLMIIGLHQTNHFDYPAITYFGINTADRIQQLKAKGLSNFSESGGKNNQVLRTWEGQHFFIFSLGM